MEDISTAQNEVNEIISDFSIDDLDSNSYIDDDNVTIENETSNDDKNNSGKEDKAEPEPQPQPAKKTEEKTGKEENVNQKDLFSFLKTGENGEQTFDFNAAMDFIDTGKSDTRANVQNLTKQQDTKVDKPENDESFQDNYEVTLRNNYLASLSYAESIANQYNLPQETMNVFKNILSAARSAAEGDLKDHMLQRWQSEQEQRFSERQKALDEQKQTIEMLPKSKANFYELSKKYGSEEKLRALIFNPEFGGNFLMKQFVNMNPDKKNLRGEDFNKALNDWFVRFTSDKENAQILEEVARSRVLLKTWPHIVKHVKVKTENEAAMKKHGQTLKNGSSERPTRLQKDNEKSNIASYFGFN